ncbi:hypothetical protein MRX96_023773 [Rhipicephalus microplus]
MRLLAQLTSPLTHSLVQWTSGQKDSTSSPVVTLFQKDELISPMIVEVCDKETWTGSASPIVVDSEKATRDASCSPPDFGRVAFVDQHEVTSVAVSPIVTTDGTLDKATSPSETFPGVSTGVSSFTQTVGIEQSSSPHKAYTKNTSSSPFPESARHFGEGLPAAASAKPGTVDVCLGTYPEDEKVAMTRFADAACSPVAFEYSRLSRSSSDSTEVDIAVRSSSLEEATKTPMTDITAIRAMVETGTSPIFEGSHC